jgi:thiol-disulfide isomerase/thioredoxin
MAVTLHTDSDFVQALNANEKVIVKYFADWCGSCKLFAPKFKRLSNDERFAGIAFLEVNAEVSPEARKLAGVDNLPFFATFKNGQLVAAQSTSKEENVVDLLIGL